MNVHVSLSSTPVAPTRAVGRKAITRSQNVQAMGGCFKDVLAYANGDQAERFGQQLRNLLADCNLSVGSLAQVLFSSDDNQLASSKMDALLRGQKTWSPQALRKVLVFIQWDASAVQDEMDIPSPLAAELARHDWRNQPLDGLVMYGKLRRSAFCTTVLTLMNERSMSVVALGDLMVSHGELKSPNAIYPLLKTMGAWPISRISLVLSYFGMTATELAVRLPDAPDMGVAAA